MIKKLQIPKETNYFVIGLYFMIVYLFTKIIYKMMF